MTKQEAIEELAKRKLRDNFYNFCLFLNEDFFKSRKKEMEDISNELNNIYKTGGNIAISTPPRFGKSTLMNYFIAWVLLKHENNAVIRASYSQKLSTELNQGVRQILESPRYKFLQSFEMTEVENTQIKLRFKDRHRASLYASSVGGSTTGFGANVLIADDLYKDHLEALSDTTNNKTINWYHSAFASRQDENRDGLPLITIMIGTRWRVGELVDTLEMNDYFDKVIKIKALTDDNKSFNEDVITTPRLLKNQANVHPSIFTSMYQQEPMEALDVAIDRNELITVAEFPETFDWTMAILDLADKGTDNTAISLIGKSDGELYLLDVLTDQREYEYTEKRIKDFITYHKPTYFFAENNAESITIRKLIKAMKEQGINSKLFNTKKNKRIKILLNLGNIKQLRILNTTEKEYNTFINNVCKYDLSRQNQHDDEIDVLAMTFEIMGMIGV